MTKSPYPKSVYINNSEIYKVLANPKRLEILNILAKKEMSVADITNLVKSRKPNISQHLAVLRFAKLVRVRRNGSAVFYRISDPKIVAPCRIFRRLWKKNF